MTNFDNDYGLEVNDATSEQLFLEAHRREQALREMAQRGDKDPLDDLTADQLVALWQRSNEARAEKDAERQRFEAARIFTAEKPEFVQNPKNAQRIADYLEARGLDGTEVEHFHEAYGALAPRGLLKIDPRKAPQPQPRKRYSQDDLENMPMEQLIALANGR
jgi:hypothetical protein